MLQVYTLTGLPNADAFSFLVGLLRAFPLRYHQDWTPSIPLEDQLLICLMKMRRNYHLDDLAHRFSLSRTTASNCIISIAHFLGHVLYTNGILRNFPSFSKVRQAMSEAPTVPCPYQIWDCTDAFIDSPRSSLAANHSTYSAYRGGSTLKCLVSISPNGALLFVSDFYGGCISDKELVRKSGIIQYLSYGDVIYADKGFLVQDILPPGVRVNVPSFLDTNSRQFTREQVWWTCFA